MSPFVVVFIFLGLSSVDAINFTTVFEWDNLTYDGAWSMEHLRPIHPLSMAVHEDRLFLSIEIPKSRYPVTFASLVSLTTSSASSAPPKLRPYPSMAMHNVIKSCSSNIFEAKGLTVDSKSRLWVLDNGRTHFCSSKLLIFSLYANVYTVHPFSRDIVTPNIHRWNLEAIAVDETPDGWFAFIAESSSDHIIVFSLNLNRFWSVKTCERIISSLALSPKGQARQLYLGGYEELHSVPVSELRRLPARRPASLKWIANFSGRIYDMAIDNANVLYATIFWSNNISTWDLSHPDLFDKEKIFYKANQHQSLRPFNLALDPNGILWMMEKDEIPGVKPRHKLLKAVVNTVRPHAFTASADNARGQMIEDYRTIQKMNLVLRVALATTLIICGVLIFWLVLGPNKKLQDYVSMTCLHSMPLPPDDLLVVPHQVRLETPVEEQLA